jgi:hypothetical protein
MGYLESQSAYQTYRSRHPERPNPLDKVRAELEATLAGQPNMSVEFPFYSVSFVKPMTSGAL